MCLIILASIPAEVKKLLAFIAVLTDFRIKIAEEFILRIILSFVLGKNIPSALYAGAVLLDNDITLNQEDRTRNANKFMMPVLSEDVFYILEDIVITRK